MAARKPSGLTIAIVTGVLTVTGAASGSIIKSFADIKLERTKLDSQLILNALKSDSLKERRDTLLFLVDASLIANKDTSEGLKQYFEGENPKSPPHIMPFINSGESMPLERAGEKLAQKTDVDIFVCGKDKTNEEVKNLVKSANEALSKSEHFGTGKLKVWDNVLYKEISLPKLKGKTTVVMDNSLGESRERGALASILGKVSGLPNVEFMQNKGAKTPWRVSVIICTE